MAKCYSFGIFSGCVASFSGFLQNYAACAIAGALLFIGTEFSLTPGEKGLVASIILLGAILGSLLTGYFADRYGRRPVLLFSAILFVISNAPMLFISSFSLLLFLRFVTGIAAGMTSLITPLYLAEIAPPRQRGAFVASFQLAMCLGTLVAYSLNLGFAEAGHWRFMLFFLAVPASLQAIALLFIPESPKWLLGSGRTEKGLSVLHSLYSEDAKEGFLPSGEKQMRASSWKILFTPLFRKGILLGVSLAVLQQWSGINAIGYFAPIIFQEAGFSDPKSAITATLALGAFGFIATLFALFLVDRLGRRTLLLVSQGGIVLSLVFLTLAFILREYVFLSVLGLIAYLLAFNIGLGSIPWVLISEIYPLVIRAYAIALMTFLSWLSTFLVVFTFPCFLASWGPSLTFAFYASIALGAFLLFYQITPETKGKSLEEIEKSFYR